MKKTNDKTSKKLKKIGFGAETDKCWAKLRNSKLDEFSLIALDFSILENCDEWYPAYDLETLIDALPNFIIRKYKSNDNGEIKEFKEKLIIEKEEIRYSCDDIENADDANRYFQEYNYIQNISVFKKFDEKSLADTAGRLLIQLFEAGIINLKK